MSRFSTRLYFAYGSNMDPRQMALRCPQARPVGRGVLRHWRFVINDRGVATIQRERDAATWGALWAITGADEAALDRFEGVPLYYEKELAVAKLDNNARSKALVYVDPVAETGWPRPGYLSRIIRGARAFRLPSKYVSKIVTPFLQDEELPVAC